MQKVLLACAGIEQKTQQMVVLTPKGVKKRGKRKMFVTPIGVIRKTICAFFDASQSAKITFTHLTKGEASVGANSEKCPKIKRFAKVAAIQVKCCRDEHVQEGVRKPKKACSHFETKAYYLPHRKLVRIQWCAPRICFEASLFRPRVRKDMEQRRLKNFATDQTHDRSVGNNSIN